MNQINELSSLLSQHLNWNKARIFCFSGILIGLMKVRSINLTKIALAFPSSATPDSRYRRIQRFIHQYPIDFNVIALLIMTMFQFISRNFHITLDRTNWKWGKKNINFFVLAIAYKGTAIPIYWILLNKKGNSKTCERIALMKRFVKQFGKEHIISVLADREFIGEAWLKWLKSEGIPFHIRIKKDAQVTNSRGKTVRVETLFRFLKVGESLTIQGLRKMTGLEVYLSCLRLEDGELLIIASTKQAELAIKRYAKRWEIETLFSCFKGRGFNLEDTHITKLIRLKRLLVPVVIAFYWAHRTGEWRNEQKPIKIKKHTRLAKSIFRVGLDLIQDKLFNGVGSLKFIFEFIFQQTDFKEEKQVISIV